MCSIAIYCVLIHRCTNIKIVPIVTSKKMNCVPMSGHYTISDSWRWNHITHLHLYWLPFSSPSWLTRICISYRNLFSLLLAIVSTIHTCLSKKSVYSRFVAFFFTSVVLFDILIICLTFRDQVFKHFISVFWCFAFTFDNLL